MNLPNVFPNLPDDCFVPGDHRDTAVFAQVGNDASRFPQDQVGGAYVPFVQRQFPVTVQQSGGDAADVVSRGPQPPYIPYA